MAKLNSLKTLHGEITLPTFFPDGTRGVVKGVDSTDLKNCQIEGLVINTYHLLVNSMDDKLKNFTDMHDLMHWSGPFITDSGGFQVMSLVHKQSLRPGGLRHPESGKIKDDEIVFKLDGQGRVVLTPEKSIQMQLRLGTDIAIVLDDCTFPDQDLSIQKKSVERTINWAKRSKAEFEKLTSQPRKVGPCKAKPLIFAVVQGGNSKKLRKFCAQELIKIGFDGYCYGGFPVDKNGKFLSDILEYTANLLPDDKPKYALGVGKPENIVECVKMGYTIFDCVIPTREARHRKLYIFKDSQNLEYETLSVDSGKYNSDPKPVSQYCDCLTCKNYSRAYLHHLFKIGDTLSVRLATIHNLRFYSMLLEKLKGYSA